MRWEVLYLLQKLKHIDANFCFEVVDKRLYVTEVSHAFSPSGTNIRNLIRDCYHLQLVFGGEAMYDGKAVSAGSVFIMEPLIPHCIVNRAAEPLEQYWLQFNGSEAASLLERVGLGTKSRIITGCDLEGLRPLLYDAVYGSTRQDMLGIKFVGVLLQTLAALSHKPEHETEYVSRREEYVKRAIEFLRVRCSEMATVSDAAEYVGLTEKYLCKLFKERLGVTPDGFLQQMRADRAAHLLVSTSLSVAEIAESIGIPDPTYFSRFFKRRQGLSPSEYRLKFEGNTVQPSGFVLNKEIEVAK